MTLQQKNYDPALMYGAANTVALPQTITDATSSALAVGANGATNPVLQIDASTSSVATGVKITGAATGTACAIAAIGSGTNESLSISPKAAGTVVVNGQKRPVVSGSGATVTLTADQSGSAVLMDRAAGIVFTLPTGAAGLNFEFFVTTAVTSNAYKVITAAGTELLIGGLLSDDTDTSDAIAYFPSVAGTSNIAITMNGTTTGGLAGTHFRFTCLSTTRWMVEGVVCGSGTVATPFATS
jgi:hypothetical protein